MAKTTERPKGRRTSARCGLLSVYRTASDALSSLRFSRPVAFTYNPHVYAWKPFETYLRRYGQGERPVVLLGMNPGPWGMAQTGVPFGEVSAVRDWLAIEEPVSRPKREHPKKRVQGFACSRSEVSGARLWGWAKEAYDLPERFFARYFVANYCPLMFLDDAGRNLTPDRLTAADRNALTSICDEALRGAVARLKPRYVIGVGKFAEQQARQALDGTNVTIGGILHPSPASPQANRGWQRQAEAQLRALGIEIA